ncbi:MAG: hypothetical protein LUF27_07590 [Lachnospiraceae bacterium]|nr:hypothetical protein [Lachnospiraceae bacterium]
MKNKTLNCPDLADKSPCLASTPTSSFHVNELAEVYAGIADRCEPLCSPMEFTDPSFSSVGDSYSLNISIVELSYKGEKQLSDQAQNRNCSKLYKLSMLPDNWNENGAARFSGEHIKKCVSIIRKLPFQPEVFPTAAGSIQMEYEKNSGEYLEFNVYPDHVDVYLTNSNGEEFEESIYGARQEYQVMEKLVRDFYDEDK